MVLEEFKEYFELVKEKEEFKEIDKFTHMTSFGENEDVYENIKKYLGYYHPVKDSKKFFEPDYDYLVKFLNEYFTNEHFKLEHIGNGAIDLEKTLHIKQPPIFLGAKGSFIEEQIMLTNGKKYFIKVPLSYKTRSGISNSECKFSAIIASNICKNLEVETANITLARFENGYRLMSENFLNPREEIITAIEETDSISEYINNTRKELSLRNYSIKEIDETISQYKKQEFIAKLIGLEDQKVDNSPLIHYVDEKGEKHIKMAPMMDLDYSFHIGKGLLKRQCDNGKTDIKSFIVQFQNDPELMEFIKTSILKLNMNEIYKKIYEETKLEVFKEPENLRNFTDFVNNNLKIVREAIDKDSRGVRE